MRKVLLFFFLLLSFHCFSQDSSHIAIDSVIIDSVDVTVDSVVMDPEFNDYPIFVKTFKSIDYFIPTHWSLKDSAVGDLNGDNIPDIVLILEFDSTPVKQDIISDWKAPRIILILFADKTGKQFKLALQNNFIIPTNTLGSDSLPKLIIRSRTITLPGTALNRDSYKFRFQHGAFFMIEAATEGFYGKDETWVYKYNLNYVTGKGKLTLTPYNVEDKKKKPIIKWQTIPQKPFRNLQHLKEYPYDLIFAPLFRILRQQ